MSKKYNHSKTGNSLKLKTRRTGEAIVPRGLRELELRKSSNHETVEQQFGSGFPLFGASLGVSYQTNGTVAKNKRVKSVG